MRGVARELGQAPDDAGIERPRLEAERLVCHVLGIERAELAATGEDEMDPREARRLARVVSRRSRGEPLQHIEGTVQFRELALLADGRALIPRPETEELVDRVEAWATERARTSGATVPVGRRRRRPLLDRVLDVGTGSGAIALSLVKERIAGEVVGLDVSSEALLQAAANRAAAGLGEDEVEFRLVEPDVWSGVGREERFDAIVSNPPYVADAEMEELPAQIGEYEPQVALAGGEDGLDVVRTIAGSAAGYLRPGGALFL
ncbi:MAG TPA: peptide chain release factor N(5)-glutamine methyltransferase, partial [Longimicrobiales bacterium]|nr:peptide chain release factor N(5)-glutamine methyltransferase [Longimicrobiales bacterium]